VLEPEGRQLLLDALRPDPGFELDLAVGTSYSLDLLALMTAPVAFAMFDHEGADGRLADDPIAALEALRRYASRITFFCQAGQIAVPGDFRSLFVYLEDSVHQVAPRDPERIFHPKVWGIRFRAIGGPEVRYRLLCLSRNLTFDRSWDTVLRLEGPIQAGDGPPHHPQLGAFIRSLPDLAEPIQPLAPGRRAEIETFADELARVDWQPPPPFRTVAFWGLGSGAADWPFIGRIDRLLVVSPFVTAGLLKRITGKRRGSILVSRPEAFELLGGNAVAHLAERYVLSDNAVEEETDDHGAELTSVVAELTSVVASAAVDESVAEAPGKPLSGLHAKVYVSDEGWRSRVWTGSANATDAAFGGNVEFMVELGGSKEQCGIQAMIGERTDRLGFRKLLEPYEPTALDPRPLTAAEEYERQLDRARRLFGRLRFTATCTAQTSDGYIVDLTGRAANSTLDLNAFDGLTIALRPVTLGAGHLVPVTVSEFGVEAVFALSREGLTPFFAVRIASVSDLGPPADFLINAELVGAPDDRTDRVLRDLLRNPADLIRFLLLLLGNLGDPDQRMQEATGQGAFGAWGTLGASEALLEPLVRAFSRDPDRLREIAKVMTKLSKTSDGAEILPPGWAAIWQPIALALAEDER
jgi:hypothetical protein